MVYMHLNTLYRCKATANVPAHTSTKSKPTLLRLHKTMAIESLIYWCENWAVIDSVKEKQTVGVKCLISAVGYALCNLTYPNLT